MTSLAVLSIYFGALLVWFFATARGLGLTALGIVAGSILARLWTDDLLELLGGVMASVDPLYAYIIVYVGLTLLPAMVVAARPRGNRGRSGRLFSSLVLAVLTVALTYRALESVMMVDEAAGSFVAQAMPYLDAIVTACIGLALWDILAQRDSGANSRARKKSR